jgi:hypothetical protein
MCENDENLVLVSAGYYSPSGVNEKIKCPAGFSCYDSANTIAISPTACPAGTYANEGTGICLPCSIGFACPSPKSSDLIVNCASLEGFYSDQQNLTSCKICPAGYACPKGEADKIECVPGTFAIQG